jgi:glycosyltransferase involved in cell wall biosynthesis
VDGIVFINSEQEKIARRYYETIEHVNADVFFEKFTSVIPNTCDIPWDWKSRVFLDNTQPIAPAEDQYNKHFFRDIGLERLLEEYGYRINDAVILLQHTRIVQRKRIDISIDFAFALDERYRRNEMDKCIVLLVSGHSGDEHDSIKEDLRTHFYKMMKKHPDSEGRIILFFAEQYILPVREVVVDRKYYRFRDIPGIVARHGGMGTYFSEVEGYGNNLLEMMSMGLPAVINKYPIYKSDIEDLNFILPGLEDCKLTHSVVDECFKILTDVHHRNEIVVNNIKVLLDKLDHKVVADKLTTLIKNVMEG